MLGRDAGIAQILNKDPFAPSRRAFGAVSPARGVVWLRERVGHLWAAAAGLVIAARERPVSLDPAARCASAGQLCRERGAGAKTMADVRREAVSCED